MAGLLYKEFAVNRINLISVTVMIFFFSLLMIVPLSLGGEDFADAELVSGMLSVLVFFFVFLIFGMMSSIFFETDESKKWAYFITSTPLAAKGQIRTKYLFILLTYSGLFLFCCLLSLIVAVMGGSSSIFFAFIMLWAMILFSAIEFPFLVRFGCKAGGYIKTAAGLLLMAVFFEYLFFGDLSLFNTERLMELMDRLSDPRKTADLSRFLLVLFPCVSAALYYLSYKFSCKLYLKGAEEYER